MDSNTVIAMVFTIVALLIYCVVDRILRHREYMLTGKTDYDEDDDPVEPLDKTEEQE